MRRHGVTLVLVASCMTASALFACGDDDVASPSDAGAGGDSAPTDAARDTGTLDAGSDVVVVPDGGDAAVDGGPTFSATTGSTGVISIASDGVFANFRADDTIVRSSAAPECVAHLASTSKLYSEAGKITVGGPIVGSDGGAPAPIELTPIQNSSGYSYEFFDAVFAPDAQLLVEIEKAGTPSMPAIAVQSLRTPPAPVVAITKPAQPDAGSSLVVPAGQGIPLAWTVPTGALAEHRLFIFADLEGPGAAKKVGVRCAYPLSQGQATIPASLLAELKSRVGGALTGFLTLSAGGQKEVATGGASYVIEVSRFDSTDAPPFPIDLP